MKIYTADNNDIIIEKVVDEVSTLSEDTSRNFILIVPEKLSLSMERKVLDASSRKAITNVQVLTLSRLLKRFVKKNDNYLPKESGVMIIKKIIIDNLEKLVCFNKTAKTLGFAEKIYDTISNLKNSGVTPKDLTKKVCGKVSKSLNVKMQDILLLYSEYQKYIENNNLIDASDRFILLSTLVKKSEMIKSSECYILGFDNITHSGLEVLKAVTANAKQCTFGVINNIGLNNSYIVEPEMLENVRDFCKELKISYTEVELKGSSTTIGSHIRHNLFAYPYKKMQIGNEINIIECKNIVEEVSFVAEVIRKNVIRKNLRYRDFCVACPDLEAYGKVVKSVFNDYDIPVFVDTTEKLSSHPVIKFIQLLFQCTRRSCMSNDVISLAKNFFSGVGEAQIGVFENYCIKYGINYDKFKKTFEYGESGVDGKNSSYREQAENVRNTLIEKIIQVSECLNGCSSAIQYTQAVLKMLEIFDIETKLQQFIAQLNKNNEKIEADLSKQVLDKIKNLLEEIGKIIGETKLSLDEFYGIFMSGVESTTISLIPVSVDSVFLGDASTSKVVAPKFLFVVGATDGSLPKLVEDCGIIVDNEINELSSGIGKKIEPTIKTINKRERYKFLSLLASFTQKLYITYPKVDASQAEQTPSLAVLDFKKIFYRVEEGSSLEIISLSNYRRRRLLFCEDSKDMSFAYEFSTPKVAKKKLLNYLNQENLGAMLDIVPVVSALFYALKGLKLCDDTLLKPLQTKLDKISTPEQFFFPNKTTSISQLEAYFTCPFKFFANYGLKIKEREESLLKSIDFGNVLHKIAELYIKNIDKYLKEENLAVRKHKIENLISWVFDQEKLVIASNKHIVNSLKNEAKRLIDALTYQYSVSNFKPKYEELVFGESGIVKGLDLGSGISLEGKIDRVDTMGDSFRVIDYKTGKIDLQAKNVYYGNKIQLFMYLNALKTKKNEPIGAFYLPIKNIFIEEDLGTFLSTYKLQGYFKDDANIAKNMDIQLNSNNLTSNCIVATLKADKTNNETDNFVLKKQNHILSGETLLGVMDYVLELSKVAVKEILAGNIEKSPIKNADKPACEFCEYRNCCGNVGLEGKARTTTAVSFENFAIKNKGDKKIATKKG